MIKDLRELNYYDDKLQDGINISNDFNSDYNRFIIIDEELYLDNTGKHHYELIEDATGEEINLDEQPFKDGDITYGTYIGNIALIEHLGNDEDINILYNDGDFEKVYLVNSDWTKLTRKANFGDDISTLNPEFIGYNGSERNFSNMMYNTPMGLLIPDYQDTFDNNSLLKKQYGPSINRTWEFENMRDNAEWLMQDTR